MPGLGDFYNRDSMSLEATPAPTQQDSVPVLPNPSTGEMTPAPNAQGLYAVYGAKNPYSQQAETMGNLAFRDRGSKLDFASPIAAFMAGRAQSKSQQFETDKQAKVDAYTKKLEAYDAIKANREQRISNAKYLTDTIFPAAQQAYIQTWNETKDANTASARGTEIINKMAAEAGIPIPEVAGVNFWKGATSFAVRNDKGDISTAVFKDGALAVQDKGGKFEPPTERWMSVKDAADLMRAQRPPSGGANPNGMLEYYDANGNLVAKTKDQKEAIAQGAVYAGQWVKGMDEQGNEIWQMNKVPLSKAALPRKAGNLDRQGAPAAQAPAAAQQAAQQFGRPNPVPGSPGSGQQQPPSAPAPAQPATQYLRRKTPDGRIALYDQNRNFVRYE